MKKTENKKQYIAPRLRVIELETSEVMGTSCKASPIDINVGQPDCSVDLNECSIAGS